MIVQNRTMPPESNAIASPYQKQKQVTEESTGEGVKLPMIDQPQVIAQNSGQDVLKKMSSLDMSSKDTKGQARQEANKKGQERNSAPFKIKSRYQQFNIQDHCSSLNLSGPHIDHIVTKNQALQLTNIESSEGTIERPLNADETNQSQANEMLGISR